MVYYDKAVDDYNTRTKSSSPLRITNEEMQLPDDLIMMHLNLINEYSQQIEVNKENVDAYFGKAINYGLVQDFENAIDSYNKALALRSDFALAYFCRANIRYKMLNYESSTLSSEPANKQKVDYELIIRDYNKTIELTPNFVYAWFNRGNLFFSNNDFTSAINDYSEAIAREPDFAEAYFNRGLANILVGDRKKGLSDLSKAGELGVAAAYNIIKRYS